MPFFCRFCLFFTQHQFWLSFLPLKVIWLSHFGKALYDCLCLCLCVYESRFPSFFLICLLFLNDNSTLPCLCASSMRLGCVQPDNVALDNLVLLFSSHFPGRTPTCILLFSVSYHSSCIHTHFGLSLVHSPRAGFGSR